MESSLVSLVVESRAAEQYTQFVAPWRNADPVFQPLLTRTETYWRSALRDGTRAESRK